MNAQKKRDNMLEKLINKKYRCVPLRAVKHLPLFAIILFKTDKESWQKFI